jgi:hypothetical protein
MPTPDDTGTTTTPEGETQQKDAPPKLKRNDGSTTKTPDKP